MSDHEYDLGYIPTPHDHDAAADDAFATFAATLGGERAFAFVGQGLHLNEFDDYLGDLIFPHPPTFTVLHHTVLPAASWAPFGDPARFWDAGEAGLTTAQIYAKRARQLRAIANFYRDHYHWDRGPHLFIDDRWIWVMSPLTAYGIHAKAGNGTPESYSIGIEVVGYYERTRWPAGVALLVQTAVQAIHARFAIPLAYRVGAGGISSHRDYNKPQCPGAAITSAYYLDVVRRGAPPGPQPPPAPALSRWRVSAERGVHVRSAPSSSAHKRGAYVRGTVLTGELRPGTAPAGEAESRWLKLSGQGDRYVWVGALERVA